VKALSNQGVPSNNLISNGVTGEIVRMTRADLVDKIRGGWVAKAYGVSFGGPTEFQSIGQIIDGPLALNQAMLKRLPGQDDMYVNMALLKAIADHGLDATAADFAHEFAFGDFPLWHANGQGRQNLLAGIPPDVSGHPRYNPHADDIDFQIECDFIGLVCPGLPQEAHKISDRAGHLMNWGDGVYGGIFVTAMYAAAFIETDVQEIVKSGLAMLPPESRYARIVSDVIAWHKKYPNDWKKTWQLVEDKYNDDMCPWGVESKFNIQASVNGAYITMGLLYGNGDLEKTVEISTRCGQDSDCNPANSGGIVGVMLGFNKMPASVQREMQPHMNSVMNFTSFSVDSATKVCVKLALENISRNGGQLDGEKISIQTQEFKPIRPLEVSFPTMTPVERYNITDQRITWSGEWTTSGEGDGAMRHSARPGDYMEVTFEGSIVYVQGDTRFDKGILDVIIDGKYMGSRDMFLPKQWKRADQTTAVWITGLADGKHTMRVVVTGRKNDYAADCQIRMGKVISYRGEIAK
jgi:hypothetical protein